MELHGLPNNRCQVPRSGQAKVASHQTDGPRMKLGYDKHILPLNPECSPVKQKVRRMKPETSLKIKEEVKKQFDAGFLAVAQYPEWVANIVPVPEKDG